MSDSNISPTDLKIVFALTIAVVSISLVFPMMGFGSTGADDPREIPTMDVDTDQFDFAGEFPTRPDTQTSGTLRYTSQSARSDQFRVFYQENNTASYWDDGGGDVLDAQDLSQYDSLIGFVTFNTYDETTDDPYAYVLVATNSEIPVTSGGYINETQVSYRDSKWVRVVTFGPDDVGQASDIQVVTGSGTPDMSLTTRFEVSEASEIPETNATADDINAVVEYEVTDSDTPDDGLLSGLPVVGAGSDILAGIILFVQQIAWVFGTVVTLIINAVSTVAQAFVFVAELVAFVTGGYASVVATAPGGLASVVLAFPGLLLGVQIIRLTMVFVNAVWIG